MSILKISPDTNTELFQQVASNYLPIFENSDVLYRNNNKQTIKKLSVNNLDLVVKRYTHKTPLGIVRTLSNFSRADNSLRIGTLLRQRGVECPKHLGIVKHLGLTNIVSDLIMEETPGISIQALLRNTQDEQIDPELLRKIANLIIALHDLGLTHGDLHSANIIIPPSGRLNLLDFDNVRKSLRRQPKDCVRILKSFWNHPKSQTTLKSLLNHIPYHFPS